MDLAEKITTGIAAIVIAVTTVVFAYYFFSFLWPFITSGGTFTTLILFCLSTVAFSFIVFAASILLALPLTILGYIVGFFILIGQYLCHQKTRQEKLPHHTGIEIFHALF